MIYQEESGWIVLEDTVVGEPAVDTLTAFPQKQARCHYCGEFGRKRNLTKDHVVPKARGGRNDPVNYVWACSKCNSAKGDNLPTCQCNHCYRAVVSHMLYINGFHPEMQAGLRRQIDGMEDNYTARKVVFIPR